MSETESLLPVVEAPGRFDCWNRIGIGGDRSCPELQVHVHCRNCPVFASAAAAFFDREAPAGYLDDWTTWLARPHECEGGDELDVQNLSQGIGLLLFRLGPEWLALRTQAVIEVTQTGPLHRIPHRTNAVLRGLVNLRGQLQLCFSLHGLLSVDDPRPGVPADDPSRAGSRERLVVLRDRERSEVWAFAADEVQGVERLSRPDLQPVPSTLANPAVSYSQAVFAWQGHTVGFLDEHRVFAALRSIGR